MEYNKNLVAFVFFSTLIICFLLIALVYNFTSIKTIIYDDSFLNTEQNHNSLYIKHLLEKHKIKHNYDDLSYNITLDEDNVNKLIEFKYNKVFTVRLPYIFNYINCNISFLNSSNTQKNIQTDEKIYVLKPNCKIFFEYDDKKWNIIHKHI